MKKNTLVDTMLEQDVISYLLEQTHYIKEANKIIDGECFTNSLLRASYLAMVELSEMNNTFTRFDVFRVLKSKESELGVDTSGVIKMMSNRIFDLTDVCFQLKEFSVKRNVSDIISRVNSQIVNGEDSAMIQSTLFSGVDSLQLEKTNEEVTHIKDIYDNVIKDLGDNAGKSKFSGIDTGSRLLNYTLGGWQSGMIVIAARPSMGKTIVGLEHAKAGAKAGANVLFLSLEMPKESLMYRFISSEATDYKYSDLGAYRVSKEDIDIISKSDARGLRDLPVFFYDSDNRDMNYLSTIITAECRKNKIDLVIIDYMQLIRDNQIKDQSDFAQVSSVSSKIQKLTRKLNIPIIALSQLSRSIESRTDKRPSLSDLRSSGNIEQDASIVIGLYRPDYYAVSEARAQNLPDPEFTHELDYVILKNRNGRTGSAIRYCDVMTNRVSDDKETLFRFTQPDILFRDSVINTIDNGFDNNNIVEAPF